MKKRNLILAVLAIVLVLCASIGAASAYFTSYAGARGGYVINLDYKSVIQEDVTGNVKTVRIYNNSDSGGTGTNPVFVRARVFSGSDSTVNFEGSSSDWTIQTVVEGREYLCVYNKPVYTGNTPTTDLKINVFVADGAKVEPGQAIDVTVTCESVPAVFNANGSPDFTTAWSEGYRTIETING